jgi:hypothetical protein
MDRQRVRVLLPGISDFHAVTEKTFVTGHVFGYRLANVILGH